MQSGSQKITVTETGQDAGLQRAFEIRLENFALSNLFGLFEAENSIIDGTLKGVSTFAILKTEEYLLLTSP
jgi:hypothetical protein